jgi:hypothetical protein
MPDTTVTKYGKTIDVSSKSATNSYAQTKTNGNYTKDTKTTENGKINYYRDLKEQIVIETFPDGLLHRYLKDLQIDCDKNDIVTTCVFHFPYRNELMSYWEPANMSVRVYGGVFDKEFLFSGRVREVKQTGYQIEVTCENIGWKLKQQIKKETLDSLKGQPVSDVVEKIFQEVDIPYHINLDEIPDINSYTLDDSCSVKLNNNTVEHVPELTDVIAAVMHSDIFNDLATDKKETTYDVDDAKDKSIDSKSTSTQKSSTTSTQKSSTTSTQKNSSTNKQKNSSTNKQKNSSTKQTNTDSSDTNTDSSDTNTSSTTHTQTRTHQYTHQAVDKSTRSIKQVAALQKKVQMTKLDRVINANSSYTPNSFRNSTSLKKQQNTNLQTVSQIDYGNYLQEMSDQLLGEPHYPESDYTYDDVLHSIASAIDAHYYIVKEKVYYISFPALFMMDSEENGFSSTPFDIDFWMQEDESLEVNVDQYGFYNTVTVNYEGGSVTATNEDLVRIYGEVPIEYDEQGISYFNAKLKAQAYLSAHIRDFGMTVKLSCLHTGKLLVGSFVKLKNPLTMSENLYYIYGNSVSWDASENTFRADLDLRYGPENPDDPQVPEVGNAVASSGTTGSADPNVSAVVAAAANEATTATDPMQIATDCCYWVATHVKYKRYANFIHNTAEILGDGTAGNKGTHLANCCDGSRLTAEMAASKGVTLEYVHMHLDGAYGHMVNRLNGVWIDWCYMYFNHIKATGNTTHGTNPVIVGTSVYPATPIDKYI